MSDTYLPGDTRQRIQDLIKDRKITQAELAEKVGLSNSALSRYLQGSTKNLGDGYIIRIAKYFDVSTDFLLGETDIPDRKNYDMFAFGQKHLNDLFVLDGIQSVSAHLFDIRDILLQKLHDLSSLRSGMSCTEEICGKCKIGRYWDLEKWKRIIAKMQFS